MRTTKSCGRACQTVTSCARLPTVSGSPGGDAYIRGRPRRTSCPVRACSTGPRETLAPLAAAADAPSRSVGLVSFRRSHRPLTLQSQLLPRGDPIRSACSLQLCREWQAPLRPIQRAARKRKRRRIYIPTRRQQPATRPVNRTHLEHGRRPNPVHARPDCSFDNPRNRTVTLHNQIRCSPISHKPRHVCFPGRSLPNDSPTTQITNQDHKPSTPSRKHFLFFVCNDTSRERLTFNTEVTPGAASPPAPKQIRSMSVSTRIDPGSFFSRQWRLIHDRLRVSNDHLFVRARATQPAVLRTCRESHRRIRKRLRDHQGSYHTSNPASQPHCNCAENGWPPCVQYSVLPASASDAGSISPPDASSLLPVLSSARTSYMVDGPMPPTVGPLTVSTIQATAPSLLTTRLLALPFPTSPGVCASTVGASCITRPVRKSRTMMIRFVCPSVNDSTSSYATIFPASVSLSTTNAPPVPPDAGPRANPLPSTYGRCP